MQHLPDSPTETPEPAPTTAPAAEEPVAEERVAEEPVAEETVDESTAELDGFSRDLDAVDAALEALDNDDLDGAEAHVAKLTADQPD